MKETPSSIGNTSKMRWCLETLLDGGKRLRRVPLHPLPFRIGRRPGSDLTLPSTLVSKEHAIIYAEGENLHLRDLGSTNGTFVNRQRIERTEIREGDILHFADFEFRLGRERVLPSQEEDEEDLGTVALSKFDLPQHFIEGTRELAELIRDRAVTPVFQPIVEFPSGNLAAYEVLGRGSHPGLPESPGQLFRIAQTVGAEAELSRVFREKALETISHRTDLPPIFLNTDPGEIADPELIPSLARFTRAHSHVRLVLEFNENLLAEPASIGGLKAELAGLGIGLAYDDFGSGQARLYELAEVPPDYLKFDIRLVRRIDRAPASRVHLLASLADASRDLGVKTIAEGIETKSEAKVCAQIGFDYAQGHFFGWPVGADRL